jgi:hypothetical protein
MALMRPFCVVEIQIIIKAMFSLRYCVVIIQVNAFILDRPPKFFYHYIVKAPSATVSTDCDAIADKCSDKFIARVLTALVSVKYLQNSIFF